MAAPETGKSLALLADLEASGAISTIGLHLANPDLPYSQYEALCAMLGTLHNATKFAIGDCIVLGEHLYREEAYQAIEAMGLSEDARREYVRVAQQVPRSVRRESLSWSHHRAVASFQRPTGNGTAPDVKKQREWLRRAENEGMSHAELREAIREGAPPAETKVCRCCHRPLP